MNIPTIYPRLGCNEVVSIKGNRFRAELWHSHKGNYYEFINVGDVDIPNFTRSEKSVSQAILEKKIKRL